MIYYVEGWWVCLGVVVFVCFFCGGLFMVLVGWLGNLGFGGLGLVWVGLLFLFFGLVCCFYVVFWGGLWLLVGCGLWICGFDFWGGCDWGFSVFLGGWFVVFGWILGFRVLDGVGII